MSDDLKIRVPVELDTSKVKDDIPKLNNVLANDNKAHAKIIGELDLNKTQKKIQSQLATISKNLKIDIGGLNVTSIQSSIKVAEKQVTSSVKNIKHEIQNIDTTLAETFKAGFNKDGQIDIVKTIENARKVLSQFGNPTFSWTKDSSGEVTQITAEVTSLTGQVEKLKYALNETNGSFDYLSGSSSEKGILKLIADIDKAKSDYTAKLSAFKSANKGIESGIGNEINAVNIAIDNLGKGGSIAEVDKLFNSLKTTASNIRQNLKSLTSSFNETTNAENTLAKMPATIQEISNSFSKLKQQPSEVSELINNLTSQLNKVNETESQFGRNEKWSEEYRELVVSVKKAETEIKNLQLLEKSDNSEAQQQASRYNKIIENISLINKLEKQRISAGKEETVEINRQIKNAKGRISTAESYLEKHKLISSEYEEQIRLLKKTGEYEQAIVKAKSADKSSATSTKTENNVARLTQNLTTLETKWKESPIFNGEFQEKFNELKTSLSNVGGDPKALDEYRIKLNELTNELKRADVAYKASFSSNKSQQNIEATRQNIKKLIYTIQTWQQANTKAMGKNTFNGGTYQVETDNMIASLKKLLNASDLTASDLKVNVDKINRSFRTMSSEAQAAGVNGLSFFDKIKEDALKFTSWMSLTTVISGISREAVKFYNNVVDIDTAMTDLRKVTDNTNQQYAEFFDNIGQKAKDLKIDLSDLISQTAEWGKRGYSLDEAETLATNSGIYSVVGEVDNATAVQDLTTVMKSYNMTVDESINIVDKFNAISNKYAVSASDIGDMLSRSVSSLSVAGNTLDQAIAMGTAITEITGDAAEAGNSLKVLSMRLRGAKTELEDAGESTEGMAVSTSKLREDIKALTNVNGTGGFDIMKDSQNFKSTYEIMKGIANVWNDLTDTSKAAIIEKIAGKQRGNTITALLTNMSQADKIVNDSIGSAGSAMSEYEKYLDSIQGRIQGFQTSIENLSATLINGDLVKFGITSGTQIIDVLDNLISKFGVLETLIPAVMAGLSFKNVGKQLLKMPTYAQPQTICA
ncbi:ATPase involved in DNA repair [uncultured Ruminococcus sp.]|nr:ATPase involved in DNA repair [uncultured Ruminococcus sp.]